MHLMFRCIHGVGVPAGGACRPGTVTATIAAVSQHVAWLSTSRASPSAGSAGSGAPPPITPPVTPAAAPPASADVVVAGAGLAGVSSAYYLARAGVKNVVVVDPLPALTATSAMSTECYRDYWPNEAMSKLMGHSIGLMEELALETDNSFDMTRRGYAYVTADPDQLETMRAVAKSLDCPDQPYRAHGPETGMSSYPRGNMGSLTPAELADPAAKMLRGIDVVAGTDNVHAALPFLADDACGLLHARRCGWVSAQQMGTAMQTAARELGVRFVRGRVVGVDTDTAGGGAKVSGIRVEMADGSGPGEHTISCPTFVNAAGPGIAAVDRLLPWDEGCGVGVGDRLPVMNEVHSKVIFRDTKGVVPRDAPMLIWSDPQIINYDDEMREAMAEHLEPSVAAKILEMAPSGVHLRPYAHDSLLLLWEYWHSDVHVGDPPPQSARGYEPPLDVEMYPEICLRGLSRMIPGLQVYLDTTFPTPIVDGGYYTQTPDNMPVVGPACGVAAEGAYVCGALSGFGVMASCGVGELLARHVTGGSIPGFGRALLPSRFEDKAYCDEVATLSDKGQI